MFMGVKALMALGVGFFLAGTTLAEDAKPAAEPAAKAVAEDVELANPEPQPFTGTGVVLINPDNAKEAMLLVQIMVPSENGESKPQVVGLPLKEDASSGKLIKDFGVTAAKPNDTEGSKKAEAEARQKFVQVEGTLNFDGNGPVLTVAKFAKSEAAPAAPADPAAAVPAAPAAKAGK